MPCNQFSHSKFLNMHRKKIIITGCCGTIGHGLLKYLANNSGLYDAILGIDNNESGLFILEREFGNNFKFAFGDIRDKERLVQLFKDVHTVIHTAALKHVAPCEIAPEEAIKTNILGVNNIISAARQTGVSKVLFTSSDKAVNPTNVMGTSKLMGERLMSAAQIDCGNYGNTTFFSTRFGNVLGSHGSVFPLFAKQIRQGGPVTITDPDMTRFVMSTEDAVSLVMESLDLAHGGEVFVSRMPAIRISDLADVMIETFAPRFGYQAEDIKVDIIGRKPGEKIYEELLTEEESTRTLQLDKFFVVLPAFRNFYELDYNYTGSVEHPVGQTYCSNNQQLLDRNQLKSYLLRNGLL